jgi:hypothetical protein
MVRFMSKSSKTMSLTRSQHENKIQIKEIFVKHKILLTTIKHFISQFNSIFECLFERTNEIFNVYV